MATDNWKLLDQYGENIGTSRDDRQVTVSTAVYTHPRTGVETNRVECRLVRLADNGREYGVAGKDDRGNKVPVCLTFTSREQVEAFVTALDTVLQDPDFDFSDPTVAAVEEEAPEPKKAPKPVINRSGRAASRTRKPKAS